MIYRTEHIGPHTLHLGDAYEILPTLGRYDALVADPQYLFETSGGGFFRKDRKNMDDIEDEGLNQGFNQAIINPLLYSSAVIFCHNDQLHTLLPYLAGCYQRYCLCAWAKDNPMPVANKHYIPELEPYIHAWSAGAHPQGDLTDKKRIWRGPNGKSVFDHPTVKPLDLMKKIMRNVNGETIIDPFMGTGTTGVAAAVSGKIFTGIEHKEKYFNIAVQRIKEAANNDKIQ